MNYIVKYKRKEKDGGTTNMLDSYDTFFAAKLRAFQLSFHKEVFDLYITFAR